MKNSSLWIRTAIIAAVTLIGIYLVIGPRGAIDANDFTWQGIKNNVSENINLGLDLRGGSQLVMRVKTDDYLRTLTENNQNAAVLAAQEAQLPVADGSFVAENNNYQITLNLTDPAQAQAVIDAVKQKVDFSGWTESTNGNQINWTLPVAAQKVLAAQAVTQAEQIIESRINAFGVKEPTFARHGATDSGQLLLQMPGVDDPERVKELIGKTSKLELMKIVGPPNPSPVQTYPTQEAAQASIAGAPNRRVLVYTDRDAPLPASPNQPEPPKQYVVVETPAVVDGNELRDAAAVSRTGNDSDYQISFSFKPNGAQKFGD